MGRVRILIAEPQDFCQEAISVLETAGQVHLHACSAAEFARAFKQFDVVWFRLGHRVGRHLLQGSLRCRVLATPVTGLDHIDLEACRESGIRVVSLRGETEFLRTIRGTAELTLGLALALLRHIPGAAASVVGGVWNRDLFRGCELYEKTAGIVGVGRLGSIVARYFQALGMRVVGYDPRPDFPNEAAERVGTLEELMSISDLISVHASYDRSTRNLIGPAQFAVVKPGAVLINTARGGILDERALLEALQTGRLSGAALDVLEGEPEVGSNPLVQYAATHSNLLIVPHIGGNTEESFRRTEVFLAKRVIEALLAQGGEA